LRSPLGATTRWRTRRCWRQPRAPPRRHAHTSMRSCTRRRDGSSVRGVGHCLTGPHTQRPRPM
jgi:hypothetical protein